MTIRDATPKDFPLIAEWAKAHGRAAFNHQAVSPFAFIVEDELGPVVFCSLHLSVGVGVAFLEGLYSRPKCKAKQVVEATDFLKEGVKRIAAEHDYGVIVCHTFPSMARFASKIGFTETHQGLVQLVLPTREAA